MMVMMWISGIASQPTEEIYLDNGIEKGEWMWEEWKEERNGG
jgi:hypothetical protein